MNAKSFFIILFVFGVQLSLATAGNIYGYTDEQGQLHLSSSPYDEKFKLISSSGSNEDVVSKKSSKNIPLHLYSTIIKETATQYQVDEALLHAVIKTESRYNPNAVSPKGATGLMQLMPATARRYGVTNAKDPAQNVQGGARYLKDLLNRFNNNLSLVLAAYNAGENAVSRHGNRLPPYRETLSYVPQVLKDYQTYSGCNNYPC
ncbi:lytic transglycosylase domain-containing protein [soil metagenome]